jgi:hypothetical protein
MRSRRPVNSDVILLSPFEGYEKDSHICDGRCILLDCSRVSLACSCNISHLAGKSEKYQVNYARKRADAVFSGVVTEIVINEKSHTYEAKFRVREWWKGVDSEEVSLFGGTDCCFCQYEFKAGEIYVVYAILDKEGKGLATSICQRTKHIGGGKRPEVSGQEQNGGKHKGRPRIRAKHNNGMQRTRN